MVNNVETVFGLTPVAKNEFAGGVQYRFEFKNGYNVLVANNRCKPRFEEGYWSASLIIFIEKGFIKPVNFYYKQASEITHLTYGDVITILSQVEKYPPVWRRDPKEVEVEWLPDNYGAKSIPWG